LQSVLGCKVCSALKKQSVPRSKVFFDAKCASASFYKLVKIQNYLYIPLCILYISGENLQEKVEISRNHLNGVLKSS
jgi:hypothetical protein